jgi:ribosomal protein L34E
MAARAPSGSLVAQVGAYRNLTATFLRYRDASRAHSRPFGAAKGARCAAARVHAGACGSAGARVRAQP